MKLTVVGFWGGYPAVNSATSGYLVEHENFKLLIDCGSGVLAQLQNYIDVTELDAVILSHYHHDHIADIGPLQFARLISFYMGKSVTQLPIYGHQEDMQGFASLDHKEYTKGIPYDPSKELEVGPFRIEFLKTTHPVPCYAMKVSTDEGSFVYTADTSYQESFIPFAKGTDLLICECNLYAHQDGKAAGHMNSHDAAKVAQGAKVPQLLLTHLPHFGDVEQLVEEAASIYKGKIDLAHKGFYWESGKK
ncbi:MBL fold metallo-hydrolase [Sutcliffiella horikoshii]|uniref:MBL fold metallo-hydrolase n=1 Tax=Sutcliffiella horikoshii TaxID=79883 RepID=UPI00203BA7EE|nr:MBL fold metallo-hydrolase [Sutcliffiella horikoshii]MCM3616962.1 MBL fold metallo-hydrolase [Sutcliffiella horikoshii]